MPNFFKRVECIAIKTAWNSIVNYGHAGELQEDT
jgi:hypothetical protein